MHPTTAMETAVESGPAASARGVTRRVVAIAAVLLAAGGALLAHSLWPTHRSHDTAAGPHVATAAAGYQVTGTGTVQISYAGPDGHLHTTTTELPWHHAESVPTSAGASLALVLTARGGHATCTLTLGGHPVQQATATGAYGRATCANQLTIH